MSLLISTLNKNYFSSMNHSLVHIRKLDTGGLKKGVRTQIKVKLGRQNFYLYSTTVNLKNEKSLSLFASNIQH